MGWQGQNKENQGLTPDELKRLVLSEESKTVNKIAKKQEKELKWTLKQELNKIDAHKRYDEKSKREKQKVQKSRGAMLQKARHRRIQSEKKQKEALFKTQQLKKKELLKRNNLLRKFQQEERRLQNFNSTLNSDSLSSNGAGGNNNNKNFSCSQSEAGELISMQQENFLEIQKRREQWEKDKRRTSRLRARRAYEKMEKGIEDKRMRIRRKLEKGQMRRQEVEMRNQH